MPLATIPKLESQSLPTLSGEPKGSWPRTTFEEMAGLHVNELENLKKMDVSSCSEKKKGKCARNIEILTERVAANTSKLCGSGTGSGNSDRAASATNQ
jgi:hypothetical protein